MWCLSTTAINTLYKVSVVGWQTQPSPAMQVCWAVWKASFRSFYFSKYARTGVTPSHGMPRCGHGGKQERQSKSGETAPKEQHYSQGSPLLESGWVWCQGLLQTLLELQEHAAERDSGERSGCSREGCVPWCSAEFSCMCLHRRSCSGFLFYISMGPVPFVNRGAERHRKSCESTGPTNNNWRYIWLSAWCYFLFAWANSILTAA